MEPVTHGIPKWRSAALKGGLLIVLMLLSFLFILGRTAWNGPSRSDPAASGKSPVRSPAGAGLSQNPSRTDRKIAFLEKEVAQPSGSIRLLPSLARTYIQKARENGDPSYFQRAEALLDRLLAENPGSQEALFLRGWLALFKHEFHEAVVWAEKGRAQHPEVSLYEGVLSDAYLEMGEYEKATRHAEKMLALKPDQGSYSRAAYLQSIRGNSDRALAFWKRAVQSGAPDAENTAWCQVELGDEYFNRGKIEEAEEAYLASLNTFPGYHRGQAGLAKVRTARNDRMEAVRLYQQAIEILPSPQYIAALGDLYLELGRPDEARKQFDLVEHIAKLDRINQRLYNRELALFYADHGLNLKEAMRLAEKEREVRSDLYTDDLLAWTYYQNRRYPEAERAIRNAMRLGTRDARLFFHAGMISRALGKENEAVRYLRRALEINPYFQPPFQGGRRAIDLNADPGKK